MDQARSPRPWGKVVLALVGVAALAAILWWAWDRDAIMRWKREASPLRFFIAMAVAPAFGVPITPLFVLAGATFGRRIGLIGSGLALTANLALCYWIARSGLRPWLTRLMRRFDYELPDFGKKSRGAWRFTLMVKAAPGIPSFVKSYGLGVAGVPFALYLGSSLLITGVYGAALIVLGESLFQHERNRSLVIGAAVAVLALAFWWWRRRRRHLRMSDPTHHKSMAVPPTTAR
jgi:uncharacterized membrane protein YdjX (TVP38/TMEM64 family)